jgi:hydroxymethylglutaryl-CoA lyase
MACGVEQFCMGVSASDTHSRKNTGMETAQATERIIAMARQAIEAGKPVQVSIQSAFGCGYEGAVPEQRVLELLQRFSSAGLKSISLADTAGHATPDRVDRLCAAVLAIDPGLSCTCHFHDTYGMAIANAWAAMKAGVETLEASFAGLGGCPFTAVAGGNLCTEDLVHLLQRMGRRPDIDLQRLIDVARDASRFFNRPLPGTIYRTGAIPSTEACGKMLPQGWHPY